MRLALAGVREAFAGQRLRPLSLPVIEFESYTARALVDPRNADQFTGGNTRWSKQP